MKTAIITGVNGMDGYYLSHHLLQKDYNVIGVMRRSSSRDNNYRLRTLSEFPNFHVVYGDITDGASINRIVQEFSPQEFYHLAANSFVGCSWQSPYHVLETNALGTIHCLEAVRQYQKDCRFYFAGSSEMFGDYVRRAGGHVILDENSPMIAASPYGVSKVAGYQMTRVYRESYDMFTSCGILFNHCHSLRGEEFFTRKVTSGLAKIRWHTESKLRLGDLNPRRDEGSSVDYTRAMWLMLQHDRPDDFVIATGETHSCQEWLDLSCKFFGLTSDEAVTIDDSLFRPSEVHILIGDASKARELLGWQPTISYKELNTKMCQYDYHLQSPDPEIYRKADQFIL